jgi:NADH-quinone oxidoreductase subunit G
MCLVQVEKAPKPLPACATPVTEGMKVFTASEQAVTAQKGVMEFLLINHPLDCPICDQGGECQLQDLAVGYGGSRSRYQEAKRVVFHKDLGPLISAEEMTRCIQCTRCIRFGPGDRRHHGARHDRPRRALRDRVVRRQDGRLRAVRQLDRRVPGGRAHVKPFRYAARTWELSRRKSVSPHDSLGSNLIVQVKGDRVMRVLPLENEAINECWLSDKDRFSYEGSIPRTACARRWSSRPANGRRSTGRPPSTSWRRA